MDSNRTTARGQSPNKPTVRPVKQASSPRRSMSPGKKSIRKPSGSSPSKTDDEMEYDVGE